MEADVSQKCFLFRSPRNSDCAVVLKQGFPNGSALRSKHLKFNRLFGAKLKYKLNLKIFALGMATLLAVNIRQSSCSLLLETRLQRPLFL